MPNIKIVLFSVLGIAVLAAGGLSLYFGLRSTNNGSNLATQYGAVASNGVECAEMAVDVLKEGGSAADAAITTLFCEGVAIAQSMGLGGGFLMTIYEKKTRTVDTVISRESAPINAKADMFLGNPQAALVGGLAVAVPGELKGYWEVHQKYGKLPWRRLVEPTIQLCKKGSFVTPNIAANLRSRSARIMAEPSLREILINPVTNQTWETGDFIKRPKLAESLEVIAREGADAIYSVNGTLLKPLVDDIQALGGIITENDFLNFYARWGSPIETEILDGKKLYTAPPPGSGILVTFILDVLKGYEFDNSPLSWHRVVEAFKYAYAKRSSLGDPDFVEGIEMLISNMTSREYTQFIHSQIDDMRTYNDPAHYGAKFTNVEDHGTAHLCVIAPNGDAVSVTSTINYLYGAFIRSTQTGIILNNLMDDFATPGFVNGFGVPASPANYIVPGKRPISAMSPIIVVDENGDVQLVIGGAGGTTIPTVTAYVILRHLYLNETIEEAMLAKRLHHQLVPNVIDYENGFDQSVLDGFMERGHVLLGSSSLSVLTAISRNADGSLTGVYDLRRGGSAITFKT